MYRPGSERNHGKVGLGICLFCKKLQRITDGHGLCLICEGYEPDPDKKEGD
jgi:hypothetical protein